MTVPTRQQVSLPSSSPVLGAPERLRGPLEDIAVALARDVVAFHGRATPEIAEHLPTRAPDQSADYSLCLALNESGSVVLTCPQVPSLMVVGDTEEEATDMAIWALQLALRPGQLIA